MVGSLSVRMRMHMRGRQAGTHASRSVSIPTSFKGRNHAQIQSKCKIKMLFPDQNLTLFRMVHFVFLPVQSNMLKMEVECKQSFREVFPPVSSA
jgi:hypothetical protein